MRVTVVVLAGLAVGAATSLLQAHLNPPWLALVNSASPWLVPAFAAGVLARRYPVAAAAGLVTCVLEVAAYFLTASVRGFSGGLGYEAFWVACGLVGGPLAGTAGAAWRSDAARWRGLGAAVLPAAFLAEGLVGYGVRLHYWSSAVLFALLGVAAAVALGWPGRRAASLVRWLPPVLAAAVLAELALGLIYRGTFG